MKDLFRVVVLSIGILSSCVLIAQEEEETDGDIDLNVVLQGQAELFLNDANKVTRTPEIKESIVELPSITYQLLARKPQQVVELKPVETCLRNRH